MTAPARTSVPETAQPAQPIDPPGAASSADTGDTAPLAELAAELRPALLRLTRIVRQQRADRSVTLTQLSTMATLGMRGEMTAGELAAFEQVQPPSMTKVLASLEERALVSRKPAPSDKRQAIIAITDAGRALLDEERIARNAWLSRRLEILTPEQRDVLHAAAPILAQLAEATTA